MADFQQRLSDFLTECKHDALLELNENKAYSAWKAKSTELHASLINRLPPDCVETFMLYQESLSAISGIESDYCYLCSIRDYLRIGRQFETPPDNEWSSLISHMIREPNDE